MKIKMARSIGFTSLVGLAAACASTPGAKPHDMSAAQHDLQGQGHAAAADRHAAQPHAEASVERTRCSRGGGRTEDGGCWTSVRNPTDEHARMAEEHRRVAAEHRAASAALGDTEARECVGIDPDDRDISPFERIEDVASVAPLTEPSDTGGTVKVAPQRAVGATVTFRAVPGMTREWLQRVVDCHLARNAALGHDVPEMPNCPLVPKGTEARVTSTGSGFAAAIRSQDGASARDILARAERLAAQVASAARRSP
jgi:hypothetical protein